MLILKDTYQEIIPSFSLSVKGTSVSRILPFTHSWVATWARAARRPQLQGVLRSTLTFMPLTSHALRPGRARSWVRVFLAAWFALGHLLLWLLSPAQCGDMGPGLTVPGTGLCCPDVSAAWLCGSSRGTLSPAIRFRPLSHSPSLVLPRWVCVRPCGTRAAFLSAHPATLCSSVESITVPFSF